MTKLIYLATPYSDSNPTVREQRFLTVNKVAADLMRQGLFIISPISHTHPIAMAGDLPTGFDFWSEYDHALLSVCCKMIVLRQPGWENSTGVQAEMMLAKALGMPIEFMDI